MKKHTIESHHNAMHRHPRNTAAPLALRCPNITIDDFDDHRRACAMTTGSEWVYFSDKDNGLRRPDPWSSCIVRIIGAVIDARDGRISLAAINRSTSNTLIRTINYSELW